MSIKILRLARSILTGDVTLQTVTFERVDVKGMEFTLLPEGFEMPAVPSATHTSPSPSSPVSGSAAATVPSTEEMGGGFHPSRRKQKQSLTDSILCDSRFIKISVKLVDMFMKAHRYCEAVETAGALLEKGLNASVRSTLLLVAARCLFRMKDVASCETALMLIATEVGRGLISESMRMGFGNVPLSPGGKHRTMGRELSMMASPFRSGRAVSQAIPIERGDSSGASTVLLTMTRTVEYMLLWDRCRLMGGDPEWAIRWLYLALDACPEGKYSQLGEVNYLLGVAYTDLCVSFQRGGVVPPEDATLECKLALEADARFRFGFCQYQKVDDALNQEKVLSKLISLHLKRLFVEVMVCKVPLEAALETKGLNGLELLEGYCWMAMEMAGNTGSPLLIMGALLNCAETSLLLSKESIAISAAQEALALLSSTYLRPETEDSAKDMDVFRTPVGKERRAECESGRVCNSSYQSPATVAETGVFRPIQGVLHPTISHPPIVMTTLQEYLGRVLRIAFLLPSWPLVNLIPSIACWNLLEAIQSQQAAANRWGAAANKKLENSTYRPYLAFLHSHEVFTSQEIGALRESLRQFLATSSSEEEDSYFNYTLRPMGREYRVHRSSSVLARVDELTTSSRESLRSTSSMSSAGTTTCTVEDAMVLLMLPFEVTRRTLAMQLGAFAPNAAGEKAGQDVLLALKEAWADARVNPQGPVALSILTRGQYVSALLAGPPKGAPTGSSLGDEEQSSPSGKATSGDPPSPSPLSNPVESAKRNGIASLPPPPSETRNSKEVKITLFFSCIQLVP